jgi:hypothetical protein
MERLKRRQAHALPAARAVIGVLDLLQHADLLFLRFVVFATGAGLQAVGQRTRILIAKN